MILNGSEHMFKMDDNLTWSFPEDKVKVEMKSFAMFSIYKIQIKQLFIRMPDLLHLVFASMFKSIL